MRRVAFKKLARELGYYHIDPAMDCVFAYNSTGGCLAWFEDDPEKLKEKAKLNRQLKPRKK